MFTEATQARQYLYPDMVFSCNGSVTKWIYGGIDHGPNPPDRLPELQIWRQATNGYTKIESSLVNAGTMIGTNLYEFIPQTPLQFQKGDIFGVHIPRTSQSTFSLYEQQESGPLNRYIRSVNSDLLTITESTLSSDPNNDFPLVAVEISKIIIIFHFKSKILLGISTNGGATVTMNTMSTGGK